MNKSNKKVSINRSFLIVRITPIILQPNNTIWQSFFVWSGKGASAKANKSVTISLNGRDIKFNDVEQKPQSIEIIFLK